ncbi:MAG: hypothetical protein Q9191_006955 [Dirinaria sp. TL-2023a]
MAPDDLSLAGKTALITGSGRENGVGAAIARAFARNGAAVALHYVSEGSKPRAEKVAADIARDSGNKTTVVHGSVRDYNATRQMVSQALEGLDTDHIDILGDGATQPLWKATPEHLESSFGVNVYGPIYLTQAVVNIGKMPRGGRIINIGTVVSKMGMAVAAVYAAAKAAQDSLTASWASELGFKHGITVNTLALGPVPTDTSKQYLVSPEGGPSEIHGAFVAMTRAEERVGTAEDVADAALLVASEKSRWITGQYISVSGGVTGTK